MIRPLAYVARARPRALCRARGSSRSFRATCAARRRTCSASRSARCCANGRSSFPGRIESIFNALGNVVPSHLLDRALNDFGERSRDRRRRRPTATSRSTPTIRSRAKRRARDRDRRRALTPVRTHRTTWEQHDDAFAARRAAPRAAGAPRVLYRARAGGGSGAAACRYRATSTRSCAAATCSISATARPTSARTTTR